MRSPLVLLHGFTDSPRTWELVLPALEAEHDVLAPPLAGHAGGPALPERVTPATLADAVEHALDDAGIDAAHVVGNSLGAWVALQLAERGRARSVVALAPGGGWEDGDPAIVAALERFRTMQRLLANALPNVDAIVRSPAGRRSATRDLAVRFEHIPAGLIRDQLLGAHGCPAVEPLIDLALAEGWPLDPERIRCPCGSSGARRTGCSRGRTRRRATGACCRTRTGSCSTTSATARSSTSRSRRLS